MSHEKSETHGVTVGGKKKFINLNNPHGDSADVVFQREKKRRNAGGKPKQLFDTKAAAVRAAKNRSKSFDQTGHEHEKSGRKRQGP